MTGRSVPEWIGKTPDTPVPPRVAMRVFDAHDGRCHITGREIDPVRDEWHMEHKKPLRNGGENRESNLAPALVEPHKIKTAIERHDGAKADRIRKKRLGLLKPKSRPIPGSRNSPFKHRLGKYGREAWERRT